MYALVYRVDMLQKAAFVYWFDDYKSVIHISFPPAWGMGDDVLRAFASKISIYKFATIDLMGEPMAAPSSCS